MRSLPVLYEVETSTTMACRIQPQNATECCVDNTTIADTHDFSHTPPQVATLVLDGIEDVVNGRRGDARMTKHRLPRQMHDWRSG